MHAYRARGAIIDWERAAAAPLAPPGPASWSVMSRSSRRIAGRYYRALTAPSGAAMWALVSRGNGFRAVSQWAAPASAPQASSASLSLSAAVQMARAATATAGVAVMVQRAATAAMSVYVLDSAAASVPAARTWLIAAESRVWLIPRESRS